MSLFVVVRTDLAYNDGKRYPMRLPTRRKEADDETHTGIHAH
jgi:hypothetical protein